MPTYNTVLIQSTRTPLAGDIVKLNDKLQIATKQEDGAFALDIYVLRDIPPTASTWFVTNDNDVAIYQYIGGHNINGKYNLLFCKQVVATTNPICNLPSLSSDFIKFYINKYNPKYRRTHEYFREIDPIINELVALSALEVNIKDRLFELTKLTYAARRSDITNELIKLYNKV